MVNFLLVPLTTIQRYAKKMVHGCEKFVPALAYMFCLTLPGSSIAIFAYFLADLFISDIYCMFK